MFKKLLLIMMALVMSNRGFAMNFPFVIEGFKNVPNAHMHTILEKTILSVDVLKLDIYFKPDRAKVFSEMLVQRNILPDFEEKLAHLAGHTEEAVAKIEFLHGVSLNQFLSGIQDNLVLARNAGYISDENYKEISKNLPIWYAFLRDRGIHKDDKMYYLIEPLKMRVIFMDSKGKILLDQTDFGEERRLSVMGSYFAKGSDFRQGLIQSLK